MVDPIAPERGEDLWWLVDALLTQKWAIAASLVISIGIAFGLYVIWPREYESIALFEPGFLTSSRLPEEKTMPSTGDIVGGQRVEPSESIAAKIRAGAFTVALAERLGISHREVPLIGVNIERGGWVMEMRVQHRDAALGKRVLDVILALIEKDFDGQVSARRAQRVADLEKDKNRLTELEATLKQLAHDRARLEADDRNYAKGLADTSKDITRFRDNVDRLIKAREALIKEHVGPRDDVSTLLYDNNIQGNLAQLSDLQKTRSDLIGFQSQARKDLAQTDADIRKAQLERDTVSFEMKRIEADLAMISALHIIQPPWTNPRPVWPRLLIFGIDGLAAGILLSIGFLVAGQYRVHRRGLAPRPSASGH